MFRISDLPWQRRERILGFLHEGEPVVAVLLASLDFERTVRRAIIALGTSPTKVIAVRLGREDDGRGTTANLEPRKPYSSNLEGYKEAWKEEVKPRVGKSLCHDVIKKWSVLRDAFQLRHALIHGDRGSTSVTYSTPRIEIILDATLQVHDFAKLKRCNLCTKIKARYKRRRIRTTR